MAHELDAFDDSHHPLTAPPTTTLVSDRSPASRVGVTNVRQGFSIPPYLKHESDVVHKVS